MGDPLVSARLDRRVAKALDRLARRRRQSRSDLVRRFVEEGVEAAGREDAVEAYRAGRATLWSAAQQAGLPLWTFLELLKAHRVPVPSRYGLEEAGQDIAQAKGTA